MNEGDTDTGYGQNYSRKRWAGETLAKLRLVVAPAASLAFHVQLVQDFVLAKVVRIVHLGQLRVVWLLLLLLKVVVMMVLLLLNTNTGMAVYLIILVPLHNVIVVIVQMQIVDSLSQWLLALAVQISTTLFRI